MAEKCPVCEMEHPSVETSRAGSDWSKWVCPQCGEFHVKHDAHLDRILQYDIEKRAVLSHWIRTEHESILRQLHDGQGDARAIRLDRKLIESIVKEGPPSLPEQANRFILWLGGNKKPGEPVFVQPETHQSVVGAVTPKGFVLVVDELIDDGLLKNLKGSVGAKRNIVLSWKGWERYEELRRGAVDSRKGFMAMEYGDKELDKLVDEVFKPAVKETGFDLSRLDDPDQPAGLIDDRLRVAIQTSRFLIADLSHGNRGAYWEAGYAEGLGKPVIYTCSKAIFDDEKRKPHFDTNHHLTVLWDADDPDPAAEKLKNTIRATLPGVAKLTDD